MFQVLSGLILMETTLQGHHNDHSIRNAAHLLKSTFKLLNFCQYNNFINQSGNI